MEGFQSVALESELGVSHKPRDRKLRIKVSSDRSKYKNRIELMITRNHPIQSEENSINTNRNRTRKREWSD